MDRSEVMLGMVILALSMCVSMGLAAITVYKIVKYFV